MIRSRRRQGFTLIELVVAIALSAVFLGLLLPAVRKVRDTSNRAQCQNNLRQIMLAAIMYDATNGSLPPGNDGQMVGTLVFLLPYLDQDAVYRNFSFRPDSYPYWWRDPLNYPTNPDGTGARVKTFLCPSAPDPDSGVTVVIAQTATTPGVDFAAGLFSYTAYLATPPANRDLGRNNYLSCGGYGDQGQGLFNHWPFRGMFTFQSQNRLAKIPDGAGNRLAFLESAGGFGPGFLSGGGNGDQRPGTFGHYPRRGMFLVPSRKKLKNIPYGAGNRLEFLESSGGDGQGPEGSPGPQGIPDGWWGNSWVIGEVYSAFGTCPDRRNVNCNFDPQGLGLAWSLPGSLHAYNRINVAYGDGSVRTIPPDLPFSVYVAISGIDDGYMPPPP
jgi:prepilin-type N-terminal cleavage/methylation domain-containing protein/prepilin-type processing-associated H-X9-DG protein